MLRAQPGVRDAAVVTAPTATGSMVLHAFLIPDGPLDAAPDAVEHRRGKQRATRAAPASRDGILVARGRLPADVDPQGPDATSSPRRRPRSRSPSTVLRPPTTRSARRLPGRPASGQSRTSRPWRSLGSTAWPCSIWPSPSKTRLRQGRGGGRSAAGHDRRRGPRPDGSRAGTRRRSAQSTHTRLDVPTRPASGSAHPSRSGRTASRHVPSGSAAADRPGVRPLRDQRRSCREVSISPTSHSA